MVPPHQVLRQLTLQTLDIIYIFASIQAEQRLAHAARFVGLHAERRRMKNSRIFSTVAPC
jgi:hypothetical protein